MSQTHDPTPSEVIEVPFDRKEYRRILTSSFLGSTVEYYDFLLYGTAAALVLGPLFFAGQSPAVALLASFATFTVGYLARPIGSLIFGQLGDRVGRKSTLVITMVLMGLSSTLIGLLPTSEQIGPWAAVLLVLLRILQGLAVGGEWGGAALMGLESAPKSERGFAASMANMGGPAGSMLATLVFAAFSLLPDDQFMSWGWRVPFLLSAVLVLIALFIRLRISESPMFVAAQHRAELKKAESPAKEVFTRHGKIVVVAALASLAALSYSTFMGSFGLSMAKAGGLTASAVLLCKAGSAFVHVFSIAFFARLSDRIGRKKVMLAGCVLSLVLAVPVMSMLSSGVTATVLLGFVVGNAVVQGCLYGPLAAYISEQFPTKSRYTGAGLTFQIGVVLGSFSALVSSALWPLSQSVFGDGALEYTFVGFYLMAVTVVSTIAIALSPDTRNRELIDLTDGADRTTTQPVGPSSRAATTTD